MNRVASGVAALFVMAGLGLASCSSGGASQGAGESSIGPSTTASLTLAYWDQVQTPTVEANIKAFNQKYPNIKVTTNLTGYNQYWTKLRTQAEGDNLPDVFWMNGPNIELYASNDQLAPLETDNIDYANYPKSLVDLYTVDGKHYGVPKDYDTVALWYNKNLFKAAGVDTPTSSWTWSEYHNAVKAISDANKGKGIYGVVGDLGGGQETYYDTIAQAGGYVIKDGKSGYDNPDTIRGLQFWSELLKDGSMAPVKVMTDTPVLDMFVSNKAATFWAGSWNAKSLDERYSKKDNIDVIDLPRDKQQATIIHGLAYVVSKSSSNVAAATELAAFMGSQEAALTEAKNGTAIPAFNDTQGDWLKLNPKWNLKVYTESAKNYAVPYPVSKNTAAWNAKETDLLVPAFANQGDIAQAAKQLATEMNDLLSKEK